MVKLMQRLNECNGCNHSVTPNDYRYVLLANTKNKKSACNTDKMVLY